METRKLDYSISADGNTLILVVPINSEEANWFYFCSLNQTPIRYNNYDTLALVIDIGILDEELIVTLQKINTSSDNESEDIN